MILDVEFKTRYLWFRSSALFIYTGYFIHPSWWFIINTAMISACKRFNSRCSRGSGDEDVWRCCLKFPQVLQAGRLGDRNRPTGEKGSIPDTQTVPWPVDRGVLNLSHSHLQKTETIMRFSCNQKYGISMMISLYKYEIFHVICPAAHLQRYVVQVCIFGRFEGSWNGRGEIADILHPGRFTAGTYSHHQFRKENDLNQTAMIMEPMSIFQGVPIYIYTCEVTDLSYWHSHIEQFEQQKEPLMRGLCRIIHLETKLQAQMNLCSNLVGKNGWLKFWTWEWIKHHSTNTLKQDGIDYTNLHKSSWCFGN